MTLKQDHKELKAKVDALQQELERYEPEDDEVEDRYDEVLDELYLDGWPEVLSHVRPSTVIKDYDEVGYRCGKVDWIDSQLRDNPESFDSYNKLLEQFEELQSKLEDLEAEIDDLEVELEDKIDELDDDPENEELRDEIKELQEQLG